MNKIILCLMLSLCCSSFTYSQQWTWQNPKAGLNKFTSVHFESASLGYACGYSGTIYKTTDAGATWNSQTTGTTLDLNAIYFVNDNTGFAVSGESNASGLVLKTTNGGTTWTGTSLAGAGILYSIYFINETLGWTGGDNGSMFQTTNGGTTWTAQTSNMVLMDESGNITIGSTISSIHFTTANDGYIVGQEGSICKTTDGGTSWTTINPFAYNVYEEVNPAEYGFDEDDNWVELFPAEYDSVLHTSRPAGISNFTSVVTTSSGTYALTAGSLLKTINGGTTWTSVWAHGGKSLCFVSSLVGYVANEIAVCKTTDGGSTWTGKASGTGGYNSDYASISFPDATHGFVVGDLGKIIGTIDGATWSSVSGFWGGYYGISMVDENIGFIAGVEFNVDTKRCVVLKTTNAGTNWSVNTTITDAMGLESVFFINSNEGFVVGTDNTNGVISKTTDGGANWTTQLNSDVSRLFSVFFTSPTQGYAVGDLSYTAGIILTTTNGGTNWTTQTIANTPLRRICFTDASHGFAAGNKGGEGYLLKTTDGGVTWSTPVKVMEYRYLYTMYFSSASIGWIGGEYGKILKTTDGGVSWNPPTSSEAVGEMYDIKFLDANNGFAIGSNGICVKTTDGGVNWIKIQTHTTAYLQSMAIRNNRLWICGESSTILTNGPSLALPVELSSFTASSAKNGVTLNWKTATETNNYGFEVERATKNGTLSSGAETRDDKWTKIGFVEGSGTTNAPKSYSFTDKSANGKTSYRLKQIDRDGKFEYSQSVEVTASSTPKEFGLEQNYPNPFNPTTAISYQLSANSFTTLKVYDAIGREVATLVNEVKEAGTYSAQFDGAKLSSGVYFAKLTSSGKTQMKKLLLLK